MGVGGVKMVVGLKMSLCTLGVLFVVCVVQVWGETYRLNIKTGRRNFAGTDADVYVNIIGEQGQTGKIVLGKSSTNSDAFERNQEDVFTVEGKHVGKISKVTIGHNNKGRGSAWYLDSLSIEVGTCTTTLEVWKWLYSGRLKLDAYPTLETGNCDVISYSALPARSQGRICTRDFRKVGCFRRNWKITMLITDLNKKHHEKISGKGNFTEMNWGDYALGLHSLACRCREKAVDQKYKYFAIGFFGECVAGRDTTALEAMFASVGNSHRAGCQNGKWGKCDHDHHEECGGMADYDFFYEILH